MQYRIKSDYGSCKELSEIQQIVKQELGGGFPPMDYWKGLSDLRAIGKTLYDTPSNGILTCKALRVSNASSSTCIFQQLWQKLHSQKVACVLDCWHDTAINSSLFLYHSLPMLVHWYGTVLLLSLFEFLMPSIHSI